MDSAGGAEAPKAPPLNPPLVHRKTRQTGFIPRLITAIILACMHITFVTPASKCVTEVSMSIHPSVRPSVCPVQSDPVQSNPIQSLHPSDCRSRGFEFDPSPVSYFRGDWSLNSTVILLPSADSRLVAVCLIWFFTSHQQSFSYVGTGLPVLNQY